MKAYISVDLEGMPHIVTPGHLTLKGPLYEEARKIATRITLTTADELNKNGFETVLIADSHGPMINIHVDDLPEYTEIVRGYPRPLSMITGIETCDAALFLGYHAKFGTQKSTFDHTYSGTSIRNLEINGTAASEFLLNTYTASEYQVPVILVAGETQLLNDDVQKHAPWAETMPLKKSLSRLSAISPSTKKIEANLRRTVRKATANYKQGKTKLLKPKKPIRMQITFLATHFADVAELLPTAKRTNALTVEYTAENMIQAYKTFELLALASSGMSAIMESLR